MANKPGRPRKMDAEKRVSLRHYATRAEHAEIKNWLAAGGIEFDRTGKDKRTK